MTEDSQACGGRDEQRAQATVMFAMMLLEEAATWTSRTFCINALCDTIRTCIAELAVLDQVIEEERRMRCWVDLEVCSKDLQERIKK